MIYVGSPIMGRVNSNKKSSTNFTWRYATAYALREILNTHRHPTCYSLTYMVADVVRPKSAGVNEPSHLNKPEMQLWLFSKAVLNWNDASPGRPSINISNQQDQPQHDPMRHALCGRCSTRRWYKQVYELEIWKAHGRN